MLQLGIKLSLDKSGFSGGAREAADATRNIGGAATEAAADVRALETASATAARTATTAALEQARAISQIADASAKARSNVARDALGVTIGPSPAAIAAGTASIETLKASLLDLRAVYDPVTAATLRYEVALAAVREAHRVSAIDGQLLVQREAELKAALDRTTASLSDRANAQKLAVERSVAGQTITPDRGADIAAYGSELDRLRAKFNPAWGAGQQYRQTVAEIAQAERVGAISTAEATAAREAARTATGAQVAMLRNATAAEGAHAGALKLTGFQAQNLSYQLNDVVVSLASGMNPLTVLVQQGSQITPIFGGVRGTLAAVTSVLTPMRVGLGLGATAFALAAKAAMSHSEAMHEAEIAAIGLGRNVGTSAGEIDRIAQSSASGGQISVSAARSMATEFTRTGKIGKENFAGLIAVTRNFAIATGTDAATAAKTLAELMADPAKGADTLSQSMGLVDAATARFVKRLADQGHATEAVAVLTKTLDANLAAVGQTVTWYAQVWNLVERAASGAADAIGRALSPKVGKDLMADLESRLEALKKQGATVPGLQGNTQSAPGYGIWADKGPSAPDGEKARQAEISRLEGEIAKLKKDEADAAARKQAAEVDAARARAVDVAGASSSPAVQEMVRRQQLADEQRKLAEAATGPTKLSDAEVETQKQQQKAAEDARITAAQEAKTHALTTWISESERAQQLAEIDLAIAATRDPIERAELERKRALVTMAGQDIGTTTAAATANLAYSKAIGEVSAQARGAITDTLADASARERVNALVAAGILPLADMNRELQIEAATRQLVIERDRASGAEKERLNGLIAQQRAAITAQTEAQKQANALQDVRSGEDRLQTLRTQIALVGQSEATQARVLALLEAEQKIRSQGYTGAAADQLRAQAVAGADLNTMLERQKAAWSEVQQTGGSAIDTLIEGLRTGKDVGQEMVDDLSREFLKLALANPLKNMLFGQNLPTANDVGGVLGNLFGNGSKVAAPSLLPSTVGTAQITAATVIVNGGVGSLASTTAGLTGSGSGLVALGADGKVSESYLKRLFTVESGGDPNNVTGSNLGLAQFSYADMKGFGLSNPLDPGQARLATILEAQKNSPVLSNLLGRAVSPGELYLSHQQGLAGASALFKNPDMPAWQAIRPYYGSDEIAQKAITGNGGSIDMSSKQFSDMWVKKFESGMSQAGDGLAQMSTKSASASDALGQFTPATTQAANALTNSGGGIAQASNQMGSTITTTATTTQSAFGQLTSGLSSAFSSLFSGLGNMLGGLGGGVGSLFGGIGKLFGFADGGYTGSQGRTTVAGVVHGGEFVINSWATARNRSLLEAINDNRTPVGYADGGYVATMPMIGGATPTGRPSMSPPAQPVIQQTINNHSQAQVSTHEESDGKGGRRQVILIEEAVGQALSRPRSAAHRAMQTAFGAKPQVLRR